MSRWLLIIKNACVFGALKIEDHRAENPIHAIGNLSYTWDAHCIKY